MTEELKDQWDLAASRVLRRLAAEGGIELVSSYGIAALTSPMSAFLLHDEPVKERADALADWLIEQQEVADLFASNEDLEAILVAEWDSVDAARPAATFEEDDLEEDDQDLDEADFARSDD